MNIHAVYRPFLRFFRKKRMNQFVELFGIRDGTRIIDVGGTAFNWTLIEKRPHVTMVNLPGGAEPLGNSNPNHEMVYYEGGVLPYPDGSFEICYSNSVIEHVGDDEAVRQFAAEIRRVAPAYYVQTPNKAFFIEPHYMCVGLHWLPARLRKRLVRWFSVWGWVVKPNAVEIDRFDDGIRLMTGSKLQKLFPEAQIVRERFLGMTKSLIAVRSPVPSPSTKDEDMTAERTTRERVLH